MFLFQLLLKYRILLRKVKMNVCYKRDVNLGMRYQFENILEIVLRERIQLFFRIVLIMFILKYLKVVNDVCYEIN